MRRTLVSLFIGATVVAAIFWLEPHRFGFIAAAMMFPGNILAIFLSSALKLESWAVLIALSATLNFLFYSAMAYCAFDLLPEKKGVADQG